MTPAHFREIRDAQGLSAEALSRLLGLHSGRTIRKYEAGDRPIPGPVERLMFILHDYGPNLIRPR